jgi:NAD dependent epimerase/dehydratase
MKTVLVTGADGFIGSHLTELLVKEGYQVKALSQYNSFNYWGWLEDVDCRKQIEVLNGDVRDPHYCKHITKDVDIVFHLAALIAIPYSYVAPDSYVDTNVKGTLNICQAALENGVKRVIHTSTSEVYGTALYVPIDEKHPLQAQSPYSASKIGADAMAMSFFNAFDLPLTIARPFNTYGPRQSARAVIPTIISQIANGKKQIQLGDVSPTRDFNYVTDTCRGFLRTGPLRQGHRRNGEHRLQLRDLGGRHPQSDPRTDEQRRGIPHRRAAHPSGQVRSVPAVVRQHQDPRTDRLPARIRHPRRSGRPPSNGSPARRTSPSTKPTSTTFDADHV